MRARILTICGSLAFIVFAAFVLRVGYGWSYAAGHTEQGLRTIPFLMEPGNIAYALATGQGFSNPLRIPSGPTAWMTPVYPALLAGIFRLFGIYSLRAYEAAALFNILLSTLTCVPIYWIGTRVVSRNIGATAAWLWAAFPNALIISVEAMWDATLAAFLFAVIVWASLAVASSQRLRNWALYGLLWGVTLMTSATLVLALPFIIWWGAKRVGARGPLLAAAVVFLSCAPWTVRNYTVFHALIPLRSVTGVSLWMGTIDPALGRWPGSYHPLSDSTERAKFVEMGEIAYMREKEQVAIAAMRTDPVTEIRLCAERFCALWAGGDLHAIRDFLRSHSWWFRWVVALNLVMSLSALAGLIVLAKRRDWAAFPVAAGPLIIPVAYYLTLASARYRLPIDPAVMVLASIGFAAGWRLIRAGSSGCRQRRYPA